METKWDENSKGIDFGIEGKLKAFYLQIRIKQRCLKKFNSWFRRSSKLSLGARFRHYFCPGQMKRLKKS